MWGRMDEGGRFSRPLAGSMPGHHWLYRLPTQRCIADEAEDGQDVLASLFAEEADEGGKEGWPHPFSGSSSVGPPGQSFTVMREV